MQQVGTHDKRWNVAVDYSTTNREWTVSIDYWERPGPFADWALEGRWVKPIVSLGHLDAAMNDALAELADLVQLEVGETLASWRERL